MGAFLGSPEPPDYLTASDKRDIAKGIATIGIVSICVIILIACVTVILNAVGVPWMLNLLVETVAGKAMLSIAGGMIGGMIISGVFFFSLKDDPFGAAASFVMDGAGLMISFTFIMVFLIALNRGVGIAAIGAIVFIVSFWTTRFTLPEIVSNKLNAF